MPVEMEREEFEAVVNAALDEIPDELAGVVRNVVVLVEDEAPPEDPTLLGLYDGWGFDSVDFEGPARIFVYRNNLQDMCDDVEDLREEIRITVLHEVAHHFGLDERRLHELGYG